MNRIKILEITKFVFMIISLLLIVLFGCPAYELFGILCPCCGVTRAWLAILQGNIELAFQYHALFPIIPVVGVVFVYSCCTSKSLGKMAKVIMYTLGSFVFIYGVLRWLGFVAMPYDGCIINLFFRRDIEWILQELICLL